MTISLLLIRSSAEDSKFCSDDLISKKLIVTKCCWLCIYTIHIYREREGERERERERQRKRGRERERMRKREKKKEKEKEREREREKEIISFSLIFQNLHLRISRQYGYRWVFWRFVWRLTGVSTNPVTSSGVLPASEMLAAVVGIFVLGVASGETKVAASTAVPHPMARASVQSYNQIHPVNSFLLLHLA